jgi:hypothetical protein
VGTPESRAIGSFIDSLAASTYRWETVTVECPMSFMIVNASAPVSPNRVPKVCRSEWSTRGPRRVAGSARCATALACCVSKHETGTAAHRLGAARAWRQRNGSRPAILTLRARIDRYSLLSSRNGVYGDRNREYQFEIHQRGGDHMMPRDLHRVRQ